MQEFQKQHNLQTVHPYYTDPKNGGLDIYPPKFKPTLHQGKRPPVSPFQRQLFALLSDPWASHKVGPPKSAQL